MSLTLSFAGLAAVLGSNIHAQVGEVTYLFAAGTLNQRWHDREPNVGTIVVIVPTSAGVRANVAVAGGPRPAIPLSGVVTGPDNSIIFELASSAALYILGRPMIVPLGIAPSRGVYRASLNTPSGQRDRLVDLDPGRILSPPGDIRASLEGATLDVRWAHAGDAQTYEVQVIDETHSRLLEDVLLDGAVSSATLSADRLESGGSYTVVVRAIDAALAVNVMRLPRQVNAAEASTSVEVP